MGAAADSRRVAAGDTSRVSSQQLTLASAAISPTGADQVFASLSNSGAAVVKSRLALADIVSTSQRASARSSQADQLGSVSLSASISPPNCSRHRPLPVSDT